MLSDWGQATERAVWGIRAILFAVEGSKLHYSTHKLTVTGTNCLHINSDSGSGRSVHFHHKTNSAPNMEYFDVLFGADSSLCHFRVCESALEKQLLCVNGAELLSDVTVLYVAYRAQVHRVRALREHRVLSVTAYIPLRNTRVSHT